MNRQFLRLVEEFTDTPGPRHSEEGDFSGQEFRDKLLAPRFVAAMEKGEQLVVDLDGAQGYATSFLEEAFGGLARAYGRDKVLRHLDIKSDDEPFLQDEIRNYIQDTK